MIRAVLFLSLTTLVGFAADVWAESAKKKPLPPDLNAVSTGAIVDLSRNPVGALFEAKVLASRKLIWVERAHVDMVVRELELQALFSPDGGSKRAGLGKLLKADLLVILRENHNPDDKKIKYLEMVVCETQRGLRLASPAVPITGGAEADVAALETVLNGALGKFAEKITDVCAVPPFLSNDLDYQFDYLKSAFALHLEQHLLQRKGLLLVELAEAQAIAREAILSGKESKVERPLPFYFLGSFRNTGKGDERRMELEVKLQRGEKAIGTKKKERVIPGESPKQLGRMADELADKVLAAGAAGEFDPKAEIKQLLARSKAYDLLGHWEESLAMLETALLLDPSPPALHLQASHVGAMVVLNRRRKADYDSRDAIPALTVHRRALEHMEHGLQPIEKKDPPVNPKEVRQMTAPAPSNELMLAQFTIQGIKSHLPKTEAAAALFATVMQEGRDANLRIARQRARAGIGDETSFLNSALHHTPEAERISVVRAVIKELKDLPFAEERTILFAKLSRRDLIFPPKYVAYAAFVDELASDSHPQIKAAGVILKKEHVERLALEVKKPIQAKQDPDPEVHFTPVNLYWGKLKDGKPWQLHMQDCLAAKPGLDFLFGNQVIFMMKEKGVLTMAWRTDEAYVFPRPYCFDGGLLWFSVNGHRKTPRVLVLDPETLKTWEFTAADGVLLENPDDYPNQIIKMVPLGPGRVFMAGSFGRTWLAIATLEPKDGKKTVKIFHEAREPAEAKVADHWKRTTIAFKPVGMHLVTGTKEERRVIIGRDCIDLTAKTQMHPLIVDPDAQTVEVMQERAYLGSKRFGEGARHFLSHNPESKRFDLLQIGFPGNQRKSEMTGFPEGQCLVVKDEVHVLTHTGEWWHSTFAKKQPRKVGSLPSGNLVAAWRSNHYGILIQMQENGMNQVYQAVVTPRKGPK